MRSNAYTFNTATPLVRIIVRRSRLATIAHSIPKALTGPGSVTAYLMNDDAPRIVYCVPCFCRNDSNMDSVASTAITAGLYQSGIDRDTVYERITGDGVLRQSANHHNCANHSCQHRDRTHTLIRDGNPIISLSNEHAEEHIHTSSQTVRQGKALPSWKISIIFTSTDLKSPHAGIMVRSQNQEYGND